MTERDNLIEKYYHHRFVETMDIEGNDLSYISLKKLQSNLSAEEFLFYNKLDKSTRQIINILSQEEDDDLTKDDKEVISKYKLFADNEQIPAKYRSRMYNLLIDTYDRYGGNASEFCGILGKKLDVISTEDVSDIKYVEMSANRWKRVVPKDVWNNLCKKIENKKNNKVSSVSKEDLKKVAAKLKAKYEFENISYKLSNENLPFRDQISLLEASLDLVSKIGYGRRKTYSIKSQICDRLSGMYNYALDFDTAEQYKEDRDKYIKLIKNIDKHSKGKKLNEYNR